MVESEKTVRTNLMSGVLWLSLSTLLVKVIGLIYKIPMLSYLGSVGMGYFHSAYELYALFCVIATAGLPVALSVLISAALAGGKQEEAQRIYRVSKRVFFFIGLSGSVLMVALARSFCVLIQSESAYSCILAISPTVLLVCLSSAYRGYFQGHQKMIPTAVSQLLEAVGKLIFGLLLASKAHGAGMEPPQIAAAAGWGLTLGSALSTLYLFLEKQRFQRKNTVTEKQGSIKNGGGIGRALARLAVPMTLGASAVSLTKLIDMTMILRRLQTVGYSESMANEAYGSYTALALSVFALIPSLVNSVALPLIPLLSSAIERGERDRQERLIRSSYRLTALFAVPSALGVTAYSAPILELLFGRDPRAVELAAPLLSMLGVSVLLSCMITATNAVLHAYRSVNLPIVSMLAGAAVKILSAYLLIGHPSVGIYGAPISTFLCDLTVVALNLRFAWKRCAIPQLAEIFWRPLAAALFAMCLPYTVYRLLSVNGGVSEVFILPILGATVVLYLIGACLFGAAREEELLAMPGGRALCRCLTRLRLLQKNEPEKEGCYESKGSR